MNQPPTEDAANEMRRRLLNDTIESLKKLRAREPNARDVHILMQLELDRAQLSWPTGAADVESIKNALALSAGAGQACSLVLLRLVDPELGGDITLTEPGQPIRQVPVADNSFALDDWIGAWHAAVLARDVPTLQLLCTAEVIDASTPPTDLMEPVWGAVCALLAAATVAPQHIQLWIDQVRDQASKANFAAGVSAARIESVLQLTNAIAENDPTAFLAALTPAIDAHRAFWRAQDLEHHARASWPLEAAGLTVLALDYGLIAFSDLDHLPTMFPIALFAPEPRAALSSTQVVWPTRSALSAAEANWFLDLKAIPREGRTHNLVMREDKLVGVYQFTAALVPSGTMDFVLIDQLDDSEVPPALDAGELLLLAERFASLAPPSDPTPVETSAYRDVVADAVCAIDAALLRIPTGAKSVPIETLTSAIAQRILADEPGRYRKDRMEAYRRGVVSALDQFAPTASAPTQSTTNGQSTEQPDAKTQTLAAAEVIKAGVQPLLEALAAEDGTEIAATMVPTEADFAAAFSDPADATIAQQGYAAAWSSVPEVHPLEIWQDLQIEASAAGLLQTKNALSDRFPQAYKVIAKKLTPANVWLCWRYVTSADGAGESYDGLVWLNGRWVWLPKPWRYFESENNLS